MESLVKAVKDAYAAKEAALVALESAKATHYSWDNPILDAAHEHANDCYDQLSRHCEALAFFVAGI